MVHYRIQPEYAVSKRHQPHVGCRRRRLRKRGRRGGGHLKRLSDAVADGDFIESVIRETGVAQDGRTNGITTPSAGAQANLIRRVYAKAGLDVNRQGPQYFEAHGTGTPAGDPIEAEAIHAVFGGARASDEPNAPPLYVGSVKTIIGHTEGTAGLAGLIKATLALQQRTVFPNKHFHKLNPKIEPFYKGLEIPTSPLPWPKTPDGQPRRASVNSFGFGGTNAHVIRRASITCFACIKQLTKSPKNPLFPLFYLQSASRHWPRIFRIMSTG